jgi:hypothetical protein
MDFSKNYSCQALEEIQSAYWNASMVTLHPTITYVRSMDGSMIHTSKVDVSDVLQHNASMVQAILEDLINNLKNDNPGHTNIHFWTDSPTSQYRNKSIFDLVSCSEAKCGIRASWHYFECGHGKGPCDGIGGTTKRNADNAVKQRKAVIQDGRDFMAWVSSESASQIKYRYISSEDYENNRKYVENRLKEIKTVKGTMKLHAIAAMANGRILTKETPCVCPECFGEDGFKETTNCN